MNVVKKVSWIGLLLMIAVSTANAAPKAEMIEFWNDFEPNSRLQINHSDWKEILNKYVDVNHPSGINRFNYDAVTAADHARVKTYTDLLQSMDPRQLNRQRQKAYWLNLYNAGIVLTILDARPEKSIRGVSRLWRKKRFRIAWQEMSFDDIEHGVLRPLYKDSRIHFGLIPGTLGSANVLAEPFTAENVEELLDANTRAFLEHSRGLAIDGRKIQVSTIFKWYKSDFGGSSDNIKQYIKSFVSEATAQQIDQAGGLSYDYDWGLNKP